MDSQRSHIATSIAACLALFRFQTNNSGLKQAQIKTLSKQMPLLFFICIVLHRNTLVVAYTHYGAR